jgi:hypothetical protein
MHLQENLMKLKKNFRIIRESFQELNPELLGQENEKEFELPQQETSIGIKKNKVSLNQDKMSREFSKKSYSYQNKDQSWEQEVKNESEEERHNDIIDNFIQQNKKPIATNKIEENENHNLNKQPEQSDTQSNQSESINSIQSYQKTESSKLSEFKDNFSVDDDDNEDYKEHSVEYKSGEDLNDNVSCFSDYKDISIDDRGNVHSFEDCEIFLTSLIKILRAFSKPKVGEAFEEILMSVRSRRNLEKKKRDSGKKVIIKKRTLRGTELQKINFRNNSFSGYTLSHLNL